MSTHKHFDKICCVVLAATLLITVLFMNAESFGIQAADSVMGYEELLFDASTVHTIEIVMDDWDDFIDNCKSEEYYACSVVIDNEACKNVAIRGKGNTSLTQVESYGNDRYSFKIEFDHYDSSNTYHGLDKLCLNNIIQDNTYMKDYLTYQMMNYFGVASPLCSYVYITVNGEDWGLYLAVEGVEESFLQRTYGSSYGDLYKPDSQNMGGGRGNGKQFNMDDFFGSDTDDAEPEVPDTGTDVTQDMQMPDDTINGGGTNGGMEGDPMNGGMKGGGTKGDNMQDGMSIGSDDVLLKYIDDDFDSYSNIFDNAKIDITDSDRERLIAALKNLGEGEELTDTVDIESVIRYFVVHNYVLNFDSYTGSMIHNYYLYEEDGQLSMIPWDYNLAFGGFNSSDSAASLVNYPIDSPVSGGNAEDRPMIAWIFADETYTDLYHEYFAEFISEYFDSGYFSEMIDTVSSMIAPYVESDPTKFCTYEEFETGISTLKEFCLLRAESINGQLDGAIGSTSDTQSSDTLIDAGSLTISDMGSMNGGMGGSQTQDSRIMQPGEGGMGGGMMQHGTNGMGGGMMQPGEGGMDENMILPEEGDMASDMMQPGEDGMDSDMQQPAAESNMTAPSDQALSGTLSAWIQVGISTGILILGLMFAFFFKRRR
ncbi:MAG: CotH kinase family protein [Eubacteriales bacterium]|nr:CotH kinase family protein [Eubacteriales bacterium]